MKLFHSPTSPYVRKVMVTLHETGRLGEVELIPTATVPGATDATLAGMNPLGKVPCLILDDGSALFDSRVIAAHFAIPAGLVPEADADRVRTLEALADGVLDASILCVYETRIRKEGERSEIWVTAQKEKIARALDALEAHYMAGLEGGLTLGQIAVGVTLGYLDLRFADMGWRATRPKLAAWYTAFAERPSMQATVPPAS